MLYYLTLTALGLLAVRRDRVGRLPSGAPATGRWRVFALVPCLNEEAVVGETVRRLAADPRVTVVVIDDGCTDRTGEVALGSAPEGRLRLVRRELPEAMRGKGEALNAGFRLVEQVVCTEEIDPGQVLVCVMDADGRLSTGALDKVLPLFADPGIGAAQLTVHIRNRSSFLGRLQDVEMAGVSSVAQLGRMVLGTVSLGGNGQFARLTALRDLGPRPWSRCLTEDLDLATRLAAAGWRLTTSMRAWVDQQGVESWRMLLRQRSRWAQGHMSCAGRLPSIWRAPGMSHLGAVEVMLYLLLPWTQLLWSALLLVAVARRCLALLTGESLGMVVMNDLPAIFASFTGWYVVSFAPVLIGGYLYLQRRPGTGRVKAFVYGHTLLAGAFVSSLAIWYGFFRLVIGRNSWAKTPRVAEAAAPT